MRRLLFLSLAVLAVVLPASAQAQNPVLTGVVGPDFSITLSDASGKAVSHLDPGTYTIQVQDKAAEHNFHLTGPGVDETTSVEAITNVTWTVALRDGTYRFMCDPHASLMAGSFTVGAVTSPSPAPSPSPSAPPAPSTGGGAKVTKLVGQVGPGAVLQITSSSGAKTTKVKAGSYTITVKDRTSADNFHLKGPGVDKKTSVGGMSTATWKVQLKPGRYTIGSDRSKLSVTLVVT